MAGDWLKIEKVTPEKPEIEAIADLLDIDPDAVFGKCFRIWRWFDDHTTDGNAPSVTKNAIDRRAGVIGFADALTKVGWLQLGTDGAALPNFDRHNGQTGKRRALTAKRVAAHKSKTGNAEVTHGALPREEKRRVSKEASASLDGASPETKKPSRKKFVPPTVEEVAAYVAEKGYRFDPEGFVSHYQQGGWVLKNGKKMVDWKAACTTFEKNYDRFSRGSPAARQTNADKGAAYLERRRLEMASGNT